MALQKTILSNSGLKIEDAYIRIDEYSCDKNENVNVRVRTYVSRDLMKNGASSIDDEDIISIKGDYSENAVNTKIQIYDYMKTLDKYKDSIDVLE